MGGYALYVWSSYALTALVLVINELVPRLRERRLLQQLRRRLEMAENEVNE